MLDQCEKEVKATTIEALPIKMLSETAVKELQETLNAIGHDCGKVDGIVGTKTEAAYIQYKTKHSFGLHNLIGLGTIKTMRIELSSPVFTVNPKDVDILAKTLWGEARGENRTGKIAVAWSVKNRVEYAKDKGGYWWGNTIQEVCLKPWQYSCWNKNDPNRRLILALKPGHAHFNECLDVAKQVLENAVSDPVQGATHYYATYIDPPKWVNSGTFVTQIGVHRFYKNVS